MTMAPERAAPGGSRQRGVALLIALVIMAIAATLAIGMAWDISLDQHRTANLIQGDQAMEYALGAEAWAEQILRRDMQNPQQQSGTTGNSVNLTQDWAMQLPPLPVEGGTVTGHMQDLQGLFNLNSLVGAATQSVAFVQFQRLLTALNLDSGIANAVLDWVNTGEQPHLPGGAKDETYSRLQPPYYTAERPMTSISELLLVNGVTPDVYRKLEPYVCALPLTSNNSTTNPNPVSSINVNTAPPVVLMSLASNLDLGTAAALAQNLATHPIENQSDIATLWPQLTNNQKAPSNAVITSNYFRLTVRVQIGSAHLTLYSLLYRNSTTGGTVAIRRTFGTL